MPNKHPDFIVREQHPFNGGPPPDKLVEHFTTPNDRFFVRNHGDIPQVDSAAYRLYLGIENEAPLALTLDEVRALPDLDPDHESLRELSSDLQARILSPTVCATLQCAGNRRVELNEHRHIPDEIIWDTEAVSTATWKGVRLLSLLDRLFQDRFEASLAQWHVAFEGLDTVEKDGQRFPFGGSVPLASLSANTLLAYEMNGAPLPPEHGYPLRVIVPGYIGARSVKWLSRIILQDRPSDNYYQQRAYKLFPGDVSPETVDWANGLMLGELPLNSVIATPGEGAILTAGDVVLRGFALAARDQQIARVDVSADSGQMWTQAEFLDAPAHGVWRRWQARLTLPPGEHELVCRAWDTAAQTQPERVETVWNFKGYMNNAWHRVRVRAE